MTPTLRSRRGRSFSLAAVAIAGSVLLSDATPLTQARDRSQAPPMELSPGGFTIRRLSRPVTVDGRAWIAVTPMVDTMTVNSGNGDFALSLIAPNDDGDVRRWRLRFTERGGRPVTLADLVSYAYVTGDSRWIFFEPIDVVDVRTWRGYGLSKTFGIAPYAGPEAVSADGRRLLISRRTCPFDCPEEPYEYYEIGFPAGR